MVESPGKGLGLDVIGLYDSAAAVFFKEFMQLSD